MRASLLRRIFSLRLLLRMSRNKRIRIEWKPATTTERKPAIQVVRASFSFFGVHVDVAR
eukprot:m.320882 g.320882  ORF g.320882 m.320882 type:complete len:59 (-) comp55511_c0_seq9:907-1083(-)